MFTLKNIANRAIIRNSQLPMRGLKLHEYQAGALLASHNVPIPLGEVAFSADEAFAKAAGFKGGVVVKSQALTGGRGLGHFKETGFQGGVHIVDTPEQVKEVSQQMIGNSLVTKQSGEEGVKVAAVYLVEKIGIAKELYLSITLDRGQACPVFIYSAAGGMNIEDVAHDTPELVFKMPINMAEGLHDEELKKAAHNVGLGEQADQVADMFKALYDCFIKRDCDMVEINPLVLTTDNRVVAADSKITIDSNAAFRQKELFDMEDQTSKNYKEVIAEKYDLNYIHIGGNIGCLVNGAGLAMSTMDIIKLYGGEPANFLDVGGSAAGEALVEAMKLVHNDEEVKAIFVNIFGGILKTDVLAESIIEASKTCNFYKPIVCRLKGTNSDRAKGLINEVSKELGIHYEEDFDTASQLVAKLVADME
jgi:succinyl-CoA synthetase beta subunit